MPCMIATFSSILESFFYLPLESNNPSSPRIIHWTLTDRVAIPWEENATVNNNKKVLWWPSSTLFWFYARILRPKSFREAISILSLLDNDCSLRAHKFATHELVGFIAQTCHVIVDFSFTRSKTFRLSVWNCLPVCELAPFD